MFNIGDRQVSEEILDDEFRGAARPAWSPDGRFLAADAHDSGIRIWDREAGLVSRTLEDRRVVTALAWSPNGRELASGSYDQSIFIWKLNRTAAPRILGAHTGAVLSIAWSSDGNSLASGSEDRTIRIWNIRTGRTERIFEGHAGRITLLAWSADGEFLVSGASNGELCLWRVRDGCLVGQRDRLPYRQLPTALYFGCATPFLSRFKRILLTNSWKPAATAVFAQPIAVVCAKVVLVGDADVGKSCLALRLAEGRYEPKGTTHGMQIWRLADGLDDSTETPHPGTSRELFLWDLGGQPEYQLVHQLFLHDTTAALVLLDTTRGHANYNAAEDWIRRLDLQNQGRPIRKLLVRSKLDLPVGVPDKGRVEDLVSRFGFQGYYEVSALTGAGVEPLRKALQTSLGWADAAKITRPAVYQVIREIIQTVRAENAIVFYLELEKRLNQRKVPHTSADLDTVLKQLALEGQIVDVLLDQGERVLVLRIDAVSRYAASLILAAREHPRGVPMIEPQRVLSAGMLFPGMREEDRLDRASERVVIECVVQLFLERGICLRYGGILVFPTLFTESADTEADALSHPRPLYYDFDGPIDNIYASLVARLAISGEWGPVMLWCNRAEYEDPHGGVLAIVRKDRGRGKGHLDLYVSTAVEPERRELFIKFVEDHLRTNGVAVLEGLAFECHCRGFEFDEVLLRGRLAESKETVRCPRCDAEYPLFCETTELKILTRRLHALKTEAKRRTLIAVADVKQAMAEGAVSAMRDSPIRLLHLSDLHLSGSRSVEQLLQPLSADLIDALKIETLDYLVVSGDLADRCSPEGLAEAEEFLRTLMGSFGLNASRLVLVPGNHDLDQGRSVYRLELDEPKATAVPEDRRVRKDDVYLVRDEEEYPKRFDLFRRCYKGLTQADYPLRHELQGIVMPYPDHGIEFLTLNSAWHIDRFHKERISINGDALAKALLKTDPTMKLRIAVWHHAVTGSRKVANPENIDRLIKKGYRLCLHGDVHEERNDLLNHLDSARSLHVVGAGSFSAPDSGLPPSTGRLYNVLEIGRDFRRIHVRSRAQRKIDGPFEAYAIYPAGDDPDMRRGDYWITL